MPTVFSNALQKQLHLGANVAVGHFDVGGFRVFMYKDGSHKITVKLGRHYNAIKDVAPPPAAVDWSSGQYAAVIATIIARMYLNDSLGDCVIAGKAHGIGLVSGNETGVAIAATDAEIDQNYVSICGPGDQGCNITDVLDAMKAGKFTMAGKPALIDDYVSVDWTNQTLTMVALEVFGWLTIGVNLTDDCTNSGPGVVWNFAGRIVGGHDITIYAYDEKGVYILTWGTKGTLIPWNVFTKNAGNGPGVEECYASLAPTWYSAGNLAPNGIDVASLQADLKAIGAGAVPPLTPPAPPVVPPVVPPVPPAPPAPVTPSIWQEIIAWLISFLQNDLGKKPILSGDVARQLQAELASKGFVIPWAQLLQIIETLLPLILPLLNPTPAPTGK